MKILRTTAAMIAALAIVGCVATASPPVAPVADQPVAPDQTRLSFTRSSSLLYLGAPASVDVNGLRSADLAVGQSSSVTIKPGITIVQVFAWSSPGRSTVRFNAEPGKTYRFGIAPRGESMGAGAVGGIVGQAIEGGGPFQLVTDVNQVL